MRVELGIQRHLYRLLPPAEVTKGRRAGRFGSMPNLAKTGGEKIPPSLPLRKGGTGFLFGLGMAVKTYEVIA